MLPHPQLYDAAPILHLSRQPLENVSTIFAPFLLAGTVDNGHPLIKQTLSH